MDEDTLLTRVIIPFFYNHNSHVDPWLTNRLQGQVLSLGGLYDIYILKSDTKHNKCS